MEVHIVHLQTLCLRKDVLGIQGAFRAAGAKLHKQVFQFKKKNPFQFFGCAWHHQQSGQLRLREGIPEKITTASGHWPIWGESEKVAQIPRNGGGR